MPQAFLSHNDTGTFSDSLKAVGLAEALAAWLRHLGLPDAPITVEPADRSLAATDIHRKDALLADACVLTDGQSRRVDEANATALAELGVQIDGEGYQHAGQQLNEALGADQLGKLAT